MVHRRRHREICNVGWVGEQRGNNRQILVGFSTILKSCIGRFPPPRLLQPPRRPLHPRRPSRHRPHLTDDRTISSRPQHNRPLLHRRSKINRRHQRSRLLHQSRCLWNVFVNSPCKHKYLSCVAGDFHVFSFSSSSLFVVRFLLPRKEPENRISQTWHGLSLVCMI